MDITIELASPTDLPILAEVNRLAYTPEIAARIAFPNWPDEKNMYDFFLSRIQERFDSHDTTVFKAVAIASGEIVGFVCWTLEDNNEDQPTQPIPTPTATVTQKIPQGLNMEFVMTAGRDVEGMKALMMGSKHYYVSTFVVPPLHQSKGIGTKLLKHCLEIADNENLDSWLISFPGSHSLYLRFGFRDVEFRDVDLNKWDGNKFRGYGIYRNYAMVRKPRANA